MWPGVLEVVRVQNYGFQGRESKVHSYHNGMKSKIVGWIEGQINRPETLSLRRGEHLYKSEESREYCFILTKKPSESAQSTESETSISVNAAFFIWFVEF